MLARIAPLLFVCLWATGFIGARLGLPYSEPGTFLALRFAIAFFLLVGIAVIAGASWPGGRAAAQSIFIGALIHGVYLGSVFWVIDRGMPAGIAAVVVGMQPLLTALIAGWWLKEVITRQHWIGLALGMMGVFLVLYPGLDVTSSGITILTIGVAIIGMISATAGTVFQKKFATSTDLRTGNALQYLGAFMPVMVLACFSETGTIEWSRDMIIAMVWSVLVLSIIAIFILMWLIREGSVAKVSSLFFLVPAVAAIMAYFLFNEKLTLIQLIGMFVCAVAVAMAARANRKPVA